MKISKKIICCLLVCFFTVAGVSCGKKNTEKYELVMEFITNDEIVYVHQDEPVLDMDIGTAPFKRGYFPFNVYVHVRKLKEDVQTLRRGWRALKGDGRLSPSEIYGNKFDFCSYIIYDENGKEKKLEGNEDLNAAVLRRRYYDVTSPYMFYLCNTSGLHELLFKVGEIKEYNIPETTFKVNLYAKEDERKDGVEIIAEDNPNITKIDGEENWEDIYLVAKGTQFPQFHLYDKYTGEQIYETVDSNYRMFSPEYEKYPGYSPNRKIYIAYVQFIGNELYRPKSYFFYVIFLE